MSSTAWSGCRPSLELERAPNGGRTWWAHFDPHKRDANHPLQKERGDTDVAIGGDGDGRELSAGKAAGGPLLDAEAACRLAVYLHGLAGDLAEADEGEVAMTAGDVAGHLGDAIMELTARRKVVDRNSS